MPRSCFPMSLFLWWGYTTYIGLCKTTTSQGVSHRLTAAKSFWSHLFLLMEKRIKYGTVCVCKQHIAFL